jgi:nucleoside-diphosphate-sugar epimerase
MAYLVTGGTGFIGSYIVRQLVHQGEKVIVFDLSPASQPLDQLLTPTEMAKVHIIQGDILDFPHLVRTVQEFEVDRIIHMAALMMQASAANPSLAIKVNCEGTNNLFELARILGLKKIVWASSAAVFGGRSKHPQEYLPNDAPQYPENVYSACKSFNENMAEHYFTAYGLDSNAPRFGHVFGLGQGVGLSASWTEELVIKPALGRTGKVPLGDSLLNWLYVEDAARVTIMASKATKPNVRAFNVSGGRCSLKEAADYVRELLPDTDITLEPGCAWAAPGLDTKLTQEEIGFKPQWSIREALSEIVNTVRELHKLPPVS